MAAKAHAILSASSSDRWLHCPPSARLCETYEDKGSDYAAEGTDAHALGEYKLKTALGMPADDPTNSLKWYSEEMDDCTNGYAEYVLEQVEAAKETCADPVVLIEQRVDFSRWVEQGFGTADCIIIADGMLRVIDYKHGLGVLVSAEENPQMQCYALGALELFDDIYDIDQVSMTIYQPRRQNVSTYEISKDDLYRWADEVLKPTAELVFAGDGNFLCGEWCGFCKAKNECRARAEANLKLAQHDFKLPPLLTDTEIEVIPARRQVGNTVKQSEQKKLRVAAYCRVSTDSEEQETSYEAQVTHYTEYIQKNPDWELAGIFADDGISGTNTKKRDEFNRMIDECMAGNIDMIITKSISRFARNTLDCLQYIRQLKDKNIPVYFEKESINTLDSKGEVLLTIMASLAQQESQSMSKNIKLGLQYRFQQGKVHINHNRFLGYTKDEDGHLIIDPEQAEIVKRIYREYLEGFSMDKIAKGLMADGILTGAGKKKWHTSTINKILRNEKYMGDALLQKTFTTDFLTKKRIKNNGIVPQYYVEDDHEAIIPKDLFMQVQAELVRRRAVHVSPTRKKRSFSCNHCFAQMVFCGDCGELYRRFHWNNHGCKSIVWRCISRLEPGSAETNCTNRTVNELLLQEITVKAINQILTERKAFQKQLQSNIAKAVVSADTLSPDGIQARLEELQKELIKKANNKQDYDAIADEIFRLREQKEQSEVDSHHREKTMNRIKELQDFIAKQKTDITEFDEALVNKLIEKITVFADHFTVEFKSGLAIEIEA